MNRSAYVVFCAWLLMALLINIVQIQRNSRFVDLRRDFGTSSPVFVQLKKIIADDGLPTPEVGEPQAAAVEKIIAYIQVLKGRQACACDP